MRSVNTEGAVEYHYGAFPPQHLDHAKLLDPVVGATDALARYDQMLSAMHNSEILLAPLRNQEAVVSSRMEGTISTLDEILQIEADEEAGDDNAFKRYRSDAVEALLYSRALSLVQKRLTRGEKLSPHLVRTAHQMLLSFGRGSGKSPGSYKTEQNYIAERRTHEVSFVPIGPQQIESGIEALFKYIEENTSTPLIKTAVAHVEFEALHPFEDGNGRLGRMLITLMLWQLGIIRQPHFYVSSVFEDKRDEYIDRMRDVSEHDSWTEWVTFFLEALTTQANRNMETAERIFRLYDEMKERFRLELNSPWAINAVDFMFTNPQFRNNRFTNMSEIPSHVAMSFTRKLRDVGLLRQVVPAAGRSPGMYAFEPLLQIVRDA